jgi:hypothetical protein
VNALPARGQRLPRYVWHTIGLVLVALLAWLVWRGYQNPDFLLDLSAFRLC